MNRCQRLIIVAAGFMIGAGVVGRAQQSPSQTALDETVRTFCSAWSEPDIDRRRRILETVLTPDFTFTDPNGHTPSREALAAERVVVFQQKGPGRRIVPTSHVDSHNGLLRFTWSILSPEGKSTTEGTGFVELAPDGKMKRFVGFFGPPKPLAGTR